MQVKTIKKIISSEMTNWLASITDEVLRKDVKDNLLVSGGCITSLFQGLPVNDYDVYIQDMEVCLRLADYYSPGKVLDGRLKDHYLEKLGPVDITDKSSSELCVRYKNLKSDQIKLDISSVGVRYEADPSKKYQLAFLSPNAISLTNSIQIVLRFSGSVEHIHKSFDFIHATNYFTFSEGLVTNIKALESILTKQLSYQGSLYPLTTIIRIKKFLGRGWKIGAGEMLKVMFQISLLDLKDPQVLEEQLIGVDIAYFAQLIDILRGVDAETLTSEYLNSVIDQVFSNYDEPEIEE